MTERPVRKGYWDALFLMLLASAITAALGGMASVGAPEFYAQLDKPSWAPPPTVFGPVWTLLYAMMAVSAWLVVRSVGWKRARPAITLHLVQLVFNTLWSWIFFRWQMGALAFVEILFLGGLVALTIRAFWRASPLAGALMLPYLAWVTFAAALTYAVWQRNPGIL